MDRVTADAILNEASSVISDERMGILKDILDGKYSSSDIRETVKVLLNTQMSSGEQSKIAEVLWKIIYADDVLCEMPSGADAWYDGESIHNDQGFPLIEYIGGRYGRAMDVDMFNDIIDWLISNKPFLRMEIEIDEGLRKLLVSKAFNSCNGYKGWDLHECMNWRSEVRALIRHIRPDLHYGNKKA